MDKENALCAYGGVLFSNKEQKSCRLKEWR